MCQINRQADRAWIQMRYAGKKLYGTTRVEKSEGVVMKRVEVERDHVSGRLGRKVVAFLMQSCVGTPTQRAAASLGRNCPFADRSKNSTALSCSSKQYRTQLRMSFLVSYYRGGLRL